MKVLIAGDFCPRGRVTPFIEKEEYSTVLTNVRDYTSRADYSIVNFESPVILSNLKPIAKTGPSLCCSANGLKAIKWAGFDAVTLANNHILDYGQQGLCDTMETCESLNISFLGTSLEGIKKASSVFYKEIAGFRLAIINCCEHEFSIATESKAGSNPLNPIMQYYSIKEACENADKVIVIIHGGPEHFQLPTQRMVETYRFFIDIGADAVVNHHQHCYSGYEVYKGKPIFYGLGNFCFDSFSERNKIWTEGFMVMLNFTSHDPEFTIYPYIQCDNDPKVNFLPIGSFDEELEKLNGIIKNPNALDRAIREYYNDCADYYGNIFEPIYTKYYLGAKRRGWVPSLISKKKKLTAYNYIYCEAHRDKLMWWLKKEVNL